MLMTTPTTGYQLLLPQHRDDPLYHNYYRWRRACGDFLILDNGACEGKLATAVQLMDMATRYMVNEVVIPDTLLDGDATVQQAYKFEVVTRQWPQFRYMAVAQGQTYEGLLTCIDALAALPYVHTLAIPRHVENTVGPGTRYRLVEYISAECEQDIHLLGTNPMHMQELRAFGHFYRRFGVRGIDTASPYYYTMANKSLLAEAEERPKDYFTREVPNGELLLLNLAIMKEWVYGQ